jgi:hypothetical protein
MKRFIGFFGAILFSGVLNAQSIQEIRQSGKYIYGLGQSDIYEKADQAALSDLISQISVNVEDSLTILKTEIDGDYKEYARSVVNTYSSGSLTNALRIEEEQKGIYTVIRYFPKTDISKIFETRKYAIINYTKEGLRAEWKLQIGDALRNLYWANILLRSHPEYNSLNYYDGNDTLLLRVFLPNRINEIFSKIQMEVKEQNYDPGEKYAQYTVSMKYNNENIQNLDYMYKFKNTWSGTIGAANGLAFLEFYGEDAQKNKDIKIRVEYMYRNKAYFDKEVQSVFSSDLDLPYFNKSELSVHLEKVKSTENLITVEVETKNQKATLEENKLAKNFQEKFNDLFSAIEQGTSLAESYYFTKDGLTAYNELIEYGKAKLLSNNNKLEIIKLNNEFMIRSVPMKFSFSGNREFIENVIFILNEEGKIDDINFSLSQVAINDILSKEERFATEEVKYFLIRFMENYKTAYCLKRLDYLQKIFDEDALIIVGKVVKKSDRATDSYYSNLSNEEVTYQKLTKEQYISNLKKVFAMNEFVNIHFEDNLVKKAKRDMDIYGIQIAQHYNSETYADRGYLFLMIDLRDTLNPLIHVRTWQPHKNEDGSIYGLEDFPFEKI